VTQFLLLMRRINIVEGAGSDVGIIVVVGNTIDKFFIAFLIYVFVNYVTTEVIITAVNITTGRLINETGNRSTAINPPHDSLARRCSKHTRSYIGTAVWSLIEK